MRFFTFITICICLCSVSAVSQTVYYQHYFNPSVKFESDTFAMQFACDLNYPQYTSIDSVVVTHYKLVDRESVSFSQSILDQTITPYNCEYYLLGESTDGYGNALQTIILRNLQQATFGITITYDIAGVTNFQGFLDCPFNTATIEALPNSITQYLEPTSQIQTQDAEIIALAQQLKQSCVTIADMVEAVVLWNKENLSYDFTFNHAVQDAVSVLHNKTALCEGYSNLTCALLRSMGVPARYVAGYSVNDQLFTLSHAKGTLQFGQTEGAHAWVEVYYPSLGAWVPSEPQAHANFITPAYVPIKNTVNYTDNIQVRSQIQNLTGTKTASCKGADSDTLYYGSLVITRTEPIKPNTTYSVYNVLEVGRAHGCNNSTLPDIAQYIQGNYVVCESSTQTYKVPSIPGATSYEWTLPTGIKQVTTDTILSVQIQNFPEEGMLEVRGKNSYGLGIAAQLPIWVLLLPPAYTLNGPDEVCKGHTNAEFSIQNTGATPHWSILPGTSGTFSSTKLWLNVTNSASSGIISVYGSNTCGNGPSSDLSVVVRSKTPLPKLEDDSLHICNASILHSEIQLQNAYGNIYWIYNGELLQQQTLLPAKPQLDQPIMYKVYQQQAGCAQSDTVTGYVYLGQTLQQPIITLVTDSTLSVSTLYSYVWYADAVEFSQQQGTIQPLVEADFYVVATDEHQCSVQSNTIQFVPPVKNELPIVEKQTPYTFNKVGNTISIVVNPSMPSAALTCTLYSVTGEAIETKKAATNVQFSLHALPKTMYFVEITTPQGVYVERFVK